MAIAISKLVVQMDAENAKLHRKLEASQKKLKRFSKTTNQSLKALQSFGRLGGVALAGLAIGLAGTTKGLLATADRVGKLSVATGISTESLSQLGFAAELTGSNFESLVKGFTKLQRSMFDANEGLETQARAFDQLGVSVVNSKGELKDTEDVIGDVADSFSKMEDGAKKGALAQIIFGRAGRDMIPFLNQGRDGIAAMNKEADALGITMSGGLTKSAEEVNDNMERLGRAMQGVVLRTLEKLLPDIESLTKKMVAWSKEAENVNEAMEFMANLGRVVGSTFFILKGLFQAIAFAGASMGAALMAVASGDFSQAADIMKMGAEDSDKAWSDALDSVGGLWEAKAKDIKSKAVPLGKAIASPMAEAAKIAEKEQARIGKTMDKLRSKFSAGLKDAKKFSEDLNKEFDKRSSNLQQGSDADGGGNVLDVSLLELQAKKLLSEGDIEGAADKARQAFDVLDSIKEAGTESNLVLEGMAGKLRAIGEEVGNQKMVSIGAEIQLDLQQAQQQAQQVNKIMQEYITANPLIQKLIIDQDGGAGVAANGSGASASVTPQAANDSASNSRENNKQPVYITLPTGQDIQLEGDELEVHRMRRDLQREALRKGSR